MKNITLVGFMGTGKTAVARRLSRRLKMKYVSTDDMIEVKEKKNISKIFAENGEPYFRNSEKEVVREVSSMDNAVIAAGGGVVLSDENMRNLRSKGIIVCLNATAEDVLSRTNSYAHRPLLNVPDPLGKIRELMNARDVYYKKADYQIDTSGKTPDQVTDDVIDLLEKE